MIYGDTDSIMIYSGLDDIPKAKEMAGKVIQEVRFDYQHCKTPWDPCDLFVYSFIFPVLNTQAIYKYHVRVRTRFDSLLLVHFEILHVCTS